MKILVNHVGYPLRGSEAEIGRGILQLLPHESLPGSLWLMDSEGRSLVECPVAEPVVVAGWKSRRFAPIDIPLTKGGPYYLRSESGVVSAPFDVAPNLVAVKCVSDILFGLFANRSSGLSDDRDRTMTFYGERQGSVDVHGGWYDASGDTSKYLSHLSYTNFMNPQQTPLVCWSLLDSLERLKESAFNLGARLENRLVDEAVWGADFLLRMQDPEGYFYTTIFDRWTKDTDQRRICSYRGQDGVLSDDYQAGYRQGGGIAIAALARASTLGSIGSGEEYLDAAVRGWRHLEIHNLEYLDDGKENIIDDVCALMAAAELVGAGVTEAAATARRRAAKLVDRWDEKTSAFRADEVGRWSWFHASDEALPLIALMRSLESGVPNGRLADKCRSVLSKALLSELLRTHAVENPFQHPRHFVRMPSREDRIQFFFPHDNPSGYWWQGENARIGSWAAAVHRFLSSRRLPFTETEKDSYRRFADAQISWILGLNPFDVCMLHGRGRNNPVYEWDNFNVPGGVANGITSGFEDEDDIAFCPPKAMASGDHSWRWSEQWIPHAAWLLLAAAWSTDDGI